MSATNPENASHSEAPLTRRQLRERESVEADAHVIIEDVEPEAATAAPVSDSGLPSLFGDDEKEEVKEEPVVAAPYAREAPVAKYLDETPARRIIPPAPVAAHPQQHQRPVPKAVPHKEEWTTGAMIKVVAFSLLFVGLNIAMIAVPMAITISELGPIAP